MLKSLQIIYSMMPFYFPADVDIIYVYCIELKAVGSFSVFSGGGGGGGGVGVCVGGELL